MDKLKDAPLVRLKRPKHNPTNAEMKEDISIGATPVELARRADAGSDRIRG